MGGFTSLLLLLCVGVTLSAMLDLQKRIIGGRVCRNDERPYHVRLRSTRGNQYISCGGSLISESWILTAAHCWRDGWTISAEVGVHPNGGQPVVITVPPVIFGGHHDIMLLQLPNPTQIPHIELPACVTQGPPPPTPPGPPPPPIGATVQVAGHGPTIRGSNQPSATLQCADMTVAHCLAVDNHRRTDGSTFCGLALGVEIADGDSGGGVVYNGQIYGVIKSSVILNLNAPEAQFANVCRYKAWIQQRTGIL